MDTCEALIYALSHIYFSLQKNLNAQCGKLFVTNFYICFA